MLQRWLKADGLATDQHCCEKSRTDAFCKRVLTTNIRLRATESELRRLVTVIIQPEKECKLMLDATKKCDRDR